MLHNKNEKIKSISIGINSNATVIYQQKLYRNSFLRIYNDVQICGTNNEKIQKSIVLDLGHV